MLIITSLTIVTCLHIKESPTRCYISSNNKDKRVSCNKESSVFASSNRKSWEEWNVIETSDGLVKIFNCAHGKYMISDDHGNISTSSDVSANEGCWVLHQSGNFSFTISYHCKDANSLGERCLTCRENGDISALTDEERTDSDDQVWSLELLSGELCFLSSPALDKRLSCHPWDGKLSMSKNWDGWEVWRFIEASDGHVRISNWTHRDKFLCSDGNGNVWTTDNAVGEWELWDVERAPNGSDGVIIKSVSHGRYLKATNGKSLVSTCARFVNEPLTVWQTDAGHRQKFYVSSLHIDKRIGSSQNNVFTTNNRQSWEVWQIKQETNGFVTLYSTAHSKYLGSGIDGKLFIKTRLLGECLWKMEDSCDNSGGVYLVSSKHDRYLSIDDGGELRTIDFGKSVPVCSALWSFEPFMPHTITGDQMRKRTIGMTLAALTVVTAPFAVIGGIASIGFGAGGIASGSIAAGMMSAEAVASGGMIAAGGTVATLQSIGAAGLGVVGTSLSLGAGTVVGASILGISFAIPSEARSSYKETTDSTSSYEKRPFCEWRSW